MEMQNEELGFSQGPSENTITAVSKLQPLDEKLTTWKTKVLKEIFDCLPNLMNPIKKRLFLKL